MRIALVVNQNKPPAARFVPEFTGWLKTLGHHPTVLGRRAQSVSPSCDLVMALGGDGTLLRAVRLVRGRSVPIMGVNMGGLGFLTLFSVREARAGVRDFARSRHAETQRMLLRCRYGRRTGYCLNDCAVNMGPDNRVIDITAWADGMFVTKFVGDGVVIATPTGSTAYSLAAGGPVVLPTMEAILLTPLSPHALGARPLLLPADTRVELELSPRSDCAILNLDGQERWRVKPGHRVLLTRAGFTVRLVVPRRKDFFRIMREKLNWTGSRR